MFVLLLVQQGKVQDKTCVHVSKLNEGKFSRKANLDCCSECVALVCVAGCYQAQCDRLLCLQLNVMLLFYAFSFSLLK